MTGGPSWTINKEWTNPLYCLRYGVTCDVLRNVVELDLHNNNLVGYLSETLQQLSAATKINLGVNRLQGTIPSWYKMANLTELTLSWNSFSGEVPNLNNVSPKLTKLWLHRNQLTGGINGVSMIPTLESLDLSVNLLTDSLNNVKFYLPKLKTLNLQSNYLRGNLNWVKQLPTLTQIYITKNQFSGPATPLLALNSSILTTCAIDANAFHCPVDPEVAKKCPYTCSKCATTYDSCDLCLDPTCQWCSTDGTGVNGFCIERTSSNYVCGGGFGLKDNTCNRNCTSDAACYNRAPWSNSCSGRSLIRLLPKCDLATGKCIYPAPASACGNNCCFDSNANNCNCC
eukprot:TRINITY_DN5484_c0_g1_i1.p1 TRINITY_DN5484_c0_g1~~TRINITY_DN5484_c0_g1_i1.p1  ORF type:complete len:395 (+),score=70.11 TRINITY_DN5484_c0_g1_i1:160-1185(+)